MWIGMLIVVFAVALAFANGANDNSKGEATLIGGGLLPGKKAILYAGAATLLGSLAAVWFGAELAMWIPRFWVPPYSRFVSASPPAGPCCWPPGSECRSPRRRFERSYCGHHPDLQKTLRREGKTVKYKREFSGGLPASHPPMEVS